MANLDGKIALVTGATRGLGKGIAIGLGEAKATVYITGRTLNSSSSDVSGSLQETKEAVEAAGGKCIAVQVDHSDDGQICQLFERINQEQGGKLDLLVNNVFSGVKAIADAYQKPFWSQNPTLWDEVNHVGLRSHYISSLYAARLMSQRQTGMICTLSSWGGLSYIFGVAYGVGKSGCDRLAADMAVELKQYNITSLSIWPGIVGTELMTQFAEESQKMDKSDPQSQMISDRYNWETPLLTGRVIAALASDPNVLKLTGKMHIVAELAQRYNLTDQDGLKPVSLRSLRFILPSAIPALKKYPNLIPDIKIPWLILQRFMLQSPQKY